MVPKSNDGDDLDLLLSLQDRVPETPPGSPFPGYLSDEDDVLPRSRKQGRSGGDMSVFRDAVKDCFDYDVEASNSAIKSTTKSKKGSSDDTTVVEKFSGLRILNQVVSPTELSNRISDIRFVRLPAIKNLLQGDTFSGCWVTIGVLTEKGDQRTSSTGKPYTIWKMGCLDGKTTSVFLFGDAYKRNCNEKDGTIFALFSCGVRKDNSVLFVMRVVHWDFHEELILIVISILLLFQENGFSLSVYSAGNILKIGTSADYGVCKGKRKDGIACTIVINKRRGIYCSYHKQKTSEKYSAVKRTELFGGNLQTAFMDPLKSEKIYMVDPSISEQRNSANSSAPLKLLSVDALKKALSQAGKVTTNVYSQGIRFLTEVAGKPDPKQQSNNMKKRVSTSTRKEFEREKSCKEPDAKRIKVKGQAAAGEKVNTVGEKMIELEFISSDEEL
ncbi:OLC1v1003495C2 [Oldenlandia corymbosa var. corymbosa]|uniref:OLC1v1003495C2 n=1 Tax=Oldenlandia corymbosa var. corymbosa TaxID=529605 RepID=A0AAV1DAY0_OLDCO|nr:OLC1v1003495C2 [Oldenlandia corymbosa var. corymbosa]